MNDPVSAQSQTRGAALSALIAALGAALVLVVFVLPGIPVGESAPVMPVDDAYIHFQYARQLATGQGYAYNTGQPPTSGATSLIYPYLLAAGYALGFTGLTLGRWATALGLGALAASAWLAGSLARRFGASDGVRLWVTALFALTGSMAWHAVSGMETLLVVLGVLLTLDRFAAGRVIPLALAAALLAATRPEGSIMALTAGAAFALRDLLAQRLSVQHLTLLLPVLVTGVQPLLNLLLTGSLSASGGQAKSLLSMVPFYPDVVVGRIAEQFGRAWLELVTGAGQFDVVYLPPLLGTTAIAGAVIALRRRAHWLTLALIAAWIVGVFALIATLDTAFWHFKRYQMPLLALAFPLVGAFVTALRPRALRFGLMALWLAAAVWTFASFAGHYAMNARSVAAQPLAMARWIAANTAPDALIAVHDVGMIRYLGGRTTHDMVGLTTEGAADYWRHGPGAVAERLIRARPDDVASYPDARGLDYIAATRLYGALLADFPAEYDARYNVALGSPLQGVYAPDYTGLERQQSPQQPVTNQAVAALTLVDTVNVADLESETAHDYSWSDARREDGFATEVYDQPTLATDQALVDGGRRINGFEAFTLATQPGRDALLITRVHPVTAGTLTLYADGQRIGTRWLTPAPGHWLELMTRIPAEAVTSAETVIRIDVDTPDGHYMPYYHWLYQGDVQIEPAPESALATFQPDALLLVEAALRVEGARLIADLTWWGSGAAQGDYVRFVHVYDSLDAPPVGQTDTRPLDGSYTPGNWLAGAFHEQVVVELGANARGTFTVAVGFYDPVTFARLTPVATALDVRDSRLILGEIQAGG